MPANIYELPQEPQQPIVIQPEDSEESGEVVEVVEESGESPTKEANGDDLAELFKAPSPDDPDMQTDDLVAVDLEEDVLDGDLSDLTDVSEADVMGEDYRAAKPKKRIVRRVRRTSKRYPPSDGSLRGMRF